MAKAKRVLYVINHRTVLEAEPCILAELGFEVYVPKRIPPLNSFRSGVVTHRYDADLTIPPAAKAVLDTHYFYGRHSGKVEEWSATLETIINDHFSLVVTSLSNWVTPLFAALRGFEGVTIARPFGLEAPATYTSMLKYLGVDVDRAEFDRLGERYIFGQAYANLADVEDGAIANNPWHIPLAVPGSLFQYADTWKGGGPEILFLCPSIGDGMYYDRIYREIKTHFAALPYVIFGHQNEPIADPAVLQYMTFSELIQRYVDAPVFCYLSRELRHIHYSPIEAMVIGAPVLYYRNTLCAFIAGNADLPGACSDEFEMREKARRLLAGDSRLADAIRVGQTRIVDAFRPAAARRGWEAVLSGREQ